MSDTRFPDVPGGYPFPQLEQKVLQLWRERDIFQKSVDKPAPRGEFAFYDGPPTANNVPHVGHVVTRVVKDLFPRFRTMRGYKVPRKAGWDTHGLPVEIEVEKRLGFTGKQQIEEYGIAEFNKACLESVHTYERQWRAMTERVGYWLDLDHAYFTYTNDYIESVWWSLGELWKRGLLGEGYKIQPYCARCGTTLSSHEVAQNYKDVDDPSVWALFLVRPGQELVPVGGGSWTSTEGMKLVAWTTTPWTLTAHVGLAVNPDMVYRLVQHPDPQRENEQFLFGDELAKPVPVMAEIEGEKRLVDLAGLPALARFRGKDLEGLLYDRPYRIPREGWDGLGRGELRSGTEYTGPSDERGWQVVLGDYVTSSEGTGLVHTAPPFGEDDYRTGQTYDLPLILTIDSDGKVREKPGLEAFAGMWFKDADPKILQDLRSRGLLLHTERYRHSYPFCWRCDRPLLYYATTSWFVKTTILKQELLDQNRTIDWHPPHVGEGRFGNWLENVVDWALSRRRYWGTPLPAWKCDNCPHTTVVGSFAELFEQAGKEPPADLYDQEQFNPHRPYIDEVSWPCEKCPQGGTTGTMRRVPDVIDAWYDSGSMPFAQHHYVGKPLPQFDPETGKGFPADFISEAVDQTRGWFYTLHALGVLLFGSAAYKTCIVLGHVTDEQGRKMSKRLGNVVEPMAVIEETGADALRWYFCVNNPEVNSRFSARLVREAAQGFLLPLWNALSFFTIYANLDGWRPSSSNPLRFEDRPALDRWILLRLDRLTSEVTAGLEGYDVTEPARKIEELLDDLTNWYIRRSRDRFWAGNQEESANKESAYQALYEVLTTLARLIAPFTPFVAEVVHEHLVRSKRPDASESVHLEDWPEPPADRGDEELEASMAAIQRIVRLGHAARNTHSLKTRQPLAAVTLVTASEALPGLVTPYADLLKDELNVRDIHWAAERGEYVRHEVRPIFPKTGPRFGKKMPEVKRALESADGDALARELEQTGKITIEISDGPADLSPEEVEVRLIEREGMATQGDRELLVALDTRLTPELISEGWVREVARSIQTARKDADLDYADRIRVRYKADPEIEAAVEAHRDWIMGETLAVELAKADGADLKSAPVEGRSFAYAIEKVSTQ
ncbi:MAG TPA: isoleucine--tRNA ligase [Thermoanaerobaculia bacterium]|nr:isoleucine--tRNA ligase [Thermoanaerobaculia bacterium]